MFTKLGSHISTQKGFAFKSDWYRQDGAPIVKVSDFTDDSVDISKLTYIPNELAANYQKYCLSSGDVVIQTVGSWPNNPQSVVGKAIKIPNDASGALLNQNAVRLDPKDDLNKTYLFYLLRNERFKSYIVGCAQGAASQASITLDAIREYVFELPSLPIQRKIAYMLSAYDDLIEVNTRRIRILEQMAQSVYREWFGKVDGKSLPEGWAITTLANVSKNFDAKRIPLSSMKRAEMQGKYPYYGAAKVLDHVNDFIFDGKYLLMAEDGSVITTDGKPVLQMAYGKFWVNNHTHVLQGNNYVSTEYLYLCLSEVGISGYITGAAQPKITQANLNRIPIILPPKDLLVKFSKVFEHKFNMIETLNRQNANLRRTRDLLLPRLVSGEVEV